MKYILLTITLFIYLSFNSGITWSNPVYADTDSISSLPEIYNEKYSLFTDRSIYAVGEKIWFKVNKIGHPKIKEKDWSRVIYMELIKPDGTPVKQGKFSSATSGANGYFEIPENLLTGNYYLVAYTKWMRNFSQANYAFGHIKIVNPYKDELEPSSNGYLDNSYDTVIHATSENYIATDTQKEKRILNCQINKTTFSPREKVLLSLNYATKNLTGANDFCISVVKEGAIHITPNNTIHPDTVNEYPQPNLDYIPEIRGISISGKVISKTHNNPVYNALVQHSVLGDKFNYTSSLTTRDGKFYLVLDSVSGTNDMFITAQHKDESSLDILIDNDFSTHSFTFRPLPFTLSEIEKSTAREIMYNMQINKLYGRSDSQDTIANSKGTAFFYGKPANIINIDNYIKLPTLEEIFIELVPEVMLTKQGGKPYLKVIGHRHNQRNLDIHEPLILLDQIPVHDLDKLLQLSPDKIRSIHIVNEVFVLGNGMYGGIIHIFTKKEDMGGIDLSENSFFFDFNTFEPQQKVELPRYDNNNVESRLPDYRNCLYWNPEVKINPDETINLDFYTSDKKGKYIIYIRGIDRQGKVVEETCEFLVE